MKRMIRQINTIFKESYIVRFSYRKEDGYWVQGKEEEVVVATHIGKERNNHKEAEEVIKKKYPGCEIIRVIYV